MCNATTRMHLFWKQGGGWNRDELMYLYLIGVMVI